MGDGRIRIMGVINLTRNSFYSGSVAKSEAEIAMSAKTLEDDGADFIDIGARSTAPYRTTEVSTETEARLIVRAMKIVSGVTELPISVDTTRYEPAKKAFEEGAKILNDVFGFTQKDSKRLANLVASKDLSLLTTAHEKMTTKHSDPIETVVNSLISSMSLAKSCGIDQKKIAIDPGIGFFKDEKISNIDWNLSVLANLAELRKIERPICVGLSRKRFIGQLTSRQNPKDRLYGSLGATAVAVYNGAHLIRTHDVLQTKEAALLAMAIREKGLSHHDN